MMMTWTFLVPTTMRKLRRGKGGGGQAEGLSREESQEAGTDCQDVRPVRREAMGRRDRHERDAEELQIHREGRSRLGSFQVGSSWIWYQQASTHVRCRGRKGVN